MPAPFTRVSALPAAQRQLMERGATIAPLGRAAPGVLDHPVARPGHDRRPHGDHDDENFNPDGSRKDSDERKPDFGAQLLCRTFSGDFGLRPLPDMEFWESPDIEIDGPSGDPDRAIPGVLNIVNVHVWNLGLAHCWGVHVDLYKCEPTPGVISMHASPIGITQVLSLAPGQHKVVPFEWTPDATEDAHQCLVAHVYDPVSDPLVAPFTPPLDRHVAQRNVTVVVLPPSQVLDFSFFSSNLSFTQARTRIEVQKLEGEALQTLAQAMGREAWREAGGASVELSRPTNVAVRPHAHARELRTGSFRTALDGVPGTSEVRRVSGILRELSAPRPRDSSLAAAGETATHTMTRQEYMEVSGEPAAAYAVASSDEPGGMPVLLGPGQRVRISLRTALPVSAAHGSADVWRIVERTAGRITGGLTIIVQAK